MTMYEFMTYYMTKQYAAMLDRKLCIDDLKLSCASCPIKRECEEDGSNRSCAEMIKSQLSDGVKFR